MHALRLPALIAHYVALRDDQGLDLLCLQENRFLTEEADLPSDRIAAALGPDYRVVRDDGCPGLAFVHDARTLTCAAHAIAPLPLLAKLTPFERLYIRGGKTKQKYVLLAELRARARRRPARPGSRAACFHLDTAGGNAHRGDAGRGDRGGAARPRPATRLRRLRRQQRVRLAAPAGGAAATVRAAGGVRRDRSGDPPDPLFRPAERGQIHSPDTGVLLGKLGLDIPLRYDVVCTNLPVTERGQVDTPDSDHDLVWATYRFIRPLDAPLTHGRPGD